MLIENDDLYCFVFQVTGAPGFVVKVGRSANPDDRRDCYRNTPHYVEGVFGQATGIDCDHREITFCDIQRWPKLGHIEVEVMRRLRARWESRDLEWFYVPNLKRLFAFVDHLRGVVDYVQRVAPTQRPLFRDC